MKTHLQAIKIILCSLTLGICGVAHAAVSGMVTIPDGPFLRGDALDGNGSGDAPARWVNVSAFQMDSNLVTYAQWTAVYQWATTTSGYTFSNAGSAFSANQAVQPVQTVDWYDAVKWCNARSELENKTPCYYTDTADTGFQAIYKNGEIKLSTNNVKWDADGYRLPTEAEWEKAARGGLTGHRFPRGDRISHSEATYQSPLIPVIYDAGPNFVFPISTTPAGQLLPNGYGLHDMAGNVFEWCWDFYSSTYYTNSISTNNPIGAATGLGRVARGGSWKSEADSLRTARRAQIVAATAGDQLGFRCVLVDPGLTPAKSTPVLITNVIASSIFYGQAITNSQLSGTFTNTSGDPVDGQWAFAAPTSVPYAGTTNVPVIFTPTDTANYNPFTTNVDVFVDKTTPVLTAPVATAITTNQTLANSTFSGGSATNPNNNTAVAGSFAFTTPWPVLILGINSNVSVTFTPTASANYYSATSTVSVVVVVAPKTNVLVKVKPTATTINYGQALASSTVTGGTVTNTAGGTVVGNWAFANSSSVPNAGSANVAIIFTPTDSNYNLLTNTVSVLVTRATPVLALTAGGITYGQKLTNSNLGGSTAANPNNSAVVAGSFAFTTPSTVPNAGTPTVSVTFTPTDAANYNKVTNNASVVVGKATPVLTAPVAAAITLGQTLADSTLRGGAATNWYNHAPVAGIFTFATPSLQPNLGTNPESVTFTPTTTANYNTATTVASVVVYTPTPTKTNVLVKVKPTATPINYGQALSSSTLSGGTFTNKSGTTVPGSLTFADPTIVPNAGTTNVSVIFTPTDQNYNPTNYIVVVVVKKATPVLTLTPSDIIYGQKITNSSLSGSTAVNVNNSLPVAGSFAFTTPSTVPNAGTPTVSVTFTPTDTANYYKVTNNASVVVGKATPVLTAAATGIKYGQSLTNSNLSGSKATNSYNKASVAGSFAFTTPSLQPDAGTNNVSVIFTPTNTANYNLVTTNVNLVVVKTTPALTAPVAAAITVGQTLADSALSGGAATNSYNHAPVLGSFAFITPSIKPNAGTTNVSVTFTPNDTANYSNATTKVSVLVNKAPTNLVFMVSLTATPIIYGQTLINSTLNGTYMNMAGTPVSGSPTFANPAYVPNAGTPNVSVIFTPTDASYKKATNTVSVTVTPATLIITANNATWDMTTDYPTFTVTCDGLIAKDIFSSDTTNMVGTNTVFGTNLYVWSPAKDNISLLPNNTYTNFIIPILVGLINNNYNVSYVWGNLTIANSSVSSSAAAVASKGIVSSASLTSILGTNMLDQTGMHYIITHNLPKPPVFTNLQPYIAASSLNQPNTVKFTITNFKVQFSSNLVDWVDLTNQAITFTDTNAINTQGFYRLIGSE